MMNSNIMCGEMMWALGLIWMLVVVLLVLSIAALVKYVFRSNKHESSLPGNRSNDE